MVIGTWQLSAISCVRELSAIFDSLVLWRFHARNAACRFTSRSLTQRPIDLTGEIVMTTRFFIPALVASPRLPGKLLLLSLFLILPLFSQGVLAQDAKNNWGEAMKINPGSKLTIKTKTGRKFSGKLSTITADSITLSTAKAPGGVAALNRAALNREEIAEIRKKSGARTAGYAALLGGVGLAGGYGIGYGVGEAKEANFAVEYQTMAFGVAVGAIIGAIIGSRGEVVYKAP
jgi:hypothetical protein